MFCTSFSQDRFYLAFGKNGHVTLKECFSISFSKSHRSPEMTFNMIDADGSGRVDKGEFSLGLELCGLELEEEDIDLMWNYLDDDGGGDLDVSEMCQKLDTLHKQVAQHEEKQASKMPRLISNRLKAAIYGETYRMRVDIMKDFQDTVEQQEERWLVKFGKDVLTDLHGVCPIIALAAQELLQQQEKLIDSKVKMPALPLNYVPETLEYSAHSSILLSAGQDDAEPMWKDSNVLEIKSEILDYTKGLSNWPMVVIGDSGSGKTSLLAQTCRELQKDQPFDHILFHCVSGAPDSQELSLFLFRIIEDLKKRFHVRFDFADFHLATLKEALSQVLLKSQIDSTLILVIDNLDLLTCDAQPYWDLDWFPNTFPQRCRFIVSCQEGKLLNNLRRNRLQFGGQVELHEIMMPPIQVESIGRSASISKEANTRGEEEDSDEEDDQQTQERDHIRSDDRTDVTELGLVRSLSRSSLYVGTGLTLSSGTSLFEILELVLERAQEMYSQNLVQRYCVFVIISRCGILQQDLYELINASHHSKVVLGNCRCSWQKFRCLQSVLEPLFPVIAYGHLNLISHRSLSIIKCLNLYLSRVHADSLAEIMQNAHAICWLHYRGQLPFLYGGTWSGECRRAVSEIVHHLVHAGMWQELLDVVGNIMYIEARSSLGVHQTLALCAEYLHIIDRTDGPLHWIQSELLRIRDCHTMVQRYATQLYKHPRWVFSISANLPDSSGVSEHVKAQWTKKKEVRPQLVWINKAKVKDACLIRLQEPKIVWHMASFSRDMRFLLTVGQDPRVFIWHPVNGHIMYTLEGHFDEVMSAHFSWDGAYILSSSRDGSALLWKTPDEAPDRKAQEEEERERLSQSGSRRSGWSRARSALSRVSSCKSQDQDGHAKRAESRAGKSENILKTEKTKDINEFEEEGEDEEGAERGFSRVGSNVSRGSSVKREIKGIQNWYPISPIVATIPAHRSTVWSCAFQTIFESVAEFEVPHTVDLGHNEFRIDHVRYEANFLNFNVAGSLGPDRFPVLKKGSIKETRLLTETERNDQRIERKEAMLRRVRSAGAGETVQITRAASTGSNGSKSSVHIPIDDFQDQEKLAGQFVLIHIFRESAVSIGGIMQVRRAASKLKEQAELKRAESFGRAPSLTRAPSFGRAGSSDFTRAPSFERASSASGISLSNINSIIKGLHALGVNAIIIAMEEPGRHQEIQADMPDIDIPVMCVSLEAIQDVKDGHQITLRRKLIRGNLAATGSADHSVKVWNLAPAVERKTAQLRRPVNTLRRHTSYVSHVAFSHMGRYLCSSGGDFKVIVWNMTDFSAVGEYAEALAPVTCSVWSPDDSMILSTSHDGYFRLFRTEDYETIKATTGPHSGHLWSAAWSEDQENFVTVGHESKTVIWDLQQMIEKNKEKTILQGHHGPILSCAYSNDATKIITVSADRTVRVWACDVDLFEYSLTYANSCLVQRQAEVKTKAELKDVLSRAAKGWSNAGAGKIVFEKQGHQLAINVVVFSPDGQHLVTGSEDTQIIFWSIQKQEASRALRGHDSPISALCFAKKGEQLASGCNGGLIVLWDVSTGRKLRQFDEHIKGVGGITGESGHIRSISLNRSSSRMITSSDDFTVKLWCLDDPYAGLERTKGLTIYSDSEDDTVESSKETVANETQKEASHAGTKKADEAEQQGEALALTLEEQISRARNQREGAVLFKAYDEGQSLVMQTLRFERVMYSVAFSPDGKLVVMGSADSLIRVYCYADENQNTLLERTVIPKDGKDSTDIHRSFVKSVQFDQESRRILSAGVDGTMKLWSARNGLLLRTFVGHTQEVKQACISPDNKAVLSCSLDETCRIWNLDSGEALFEIKQNHCIFAVNFSVDGKMIATGAHDGEFKVWEKDKVDYTKKALRGWPRVREMLRRIRRLRSSPIGLSLDGRRTVLIEKTFMLDGKDADQGKVKDETQWLTVQNMVTGARDYTFMLDEPAEYCTVNETGQQIIVGRGTRLRLFQDGEQTYQVAKAHNASIRDMRLSEDGALLATASEDTNCRIWRPTAEGLLVRVKTLKGHLAGVRCVCFSPDGRHLASGSADLTVKIWNCDGWKIAVTFKAHKNYLTAVAFDVDGRKLCSAGEDQVISVWSLPREISNRSPPAETVRIRHIPSMVLACDFTECGRRVVGVTQRRHVYVWHALQGIIVCHWEFYPFDPDAYQNSMWRHALLSLNNGLNSVLVTDATGNTFKFVLMAISKPNDTAASLIEAFATLKE